MKQPTKKEIELKLMEIFSRVEAKPDIKAATKYILSLLKRDNAKTIKP